jgi:ABC-2 type transport system ATP-binding protein
MNEGRIIAQGPLEELRDRYGTTEYHVYTTVDVPDATAEDDRYRRVVESMDAVETVRELARERGGAIEDIRTVEPTLERLFLDLAESDDEGAAAGAERAREA